MKIKNLLGVSISVLLILAGVAFIVVPVKWAYSISESIPFFSEERTGDMKSAVGNIFYKDTKYAYGTDITPVLDDPIGEKADLPAQMTPEVVSKFIMAQAVVNTSMLDARLVMVWGPFVIGIFFAIGIIAILLGISLFLMQRKLDIILGGKELVKDVKKETKNMSIIDSNGKPRWKVIAAILAITVLVGAALSAIIIIRDINDTPQISYVGEVMGEHDGVCDAMVDNLCDPDCPLAPDVSADPDCTNPPTQESKTNWQTYKNGQFGFEMKYPVEWTMVKESLFGEGFNANFVSSDYQEQDSKLYQEAVNKNEETGLLHKKILARGATIFVQTTAIPADVNWCVAAGAKDQEPCDWRDWAQRATDWPYGKLASQGFSKISNREVYRREVEYYENDIVSSVISFADTKGKKLYKFVLTCLEADKQANLKIMEDIVSSFVFVDSQKNSVSGFKAYKSEKYGFEFRYSADAYEGFSIDENYSDRVCFGNHCIIVGDLQEKSLADYISKEYPAKCVTNNMDLAQKAGCTNFDIMQKDIFVGGSIGATEVQYRMAGSGREAFATYFLKDNKIYSIGYEARSPYFWLKLYDEMIKTFKFTN